MLALLTLLAVTSSYKGGGNVCICVLARVYVCLWSLTSLEYVLPIRGRHIACTGYFQSSSMSIPILLLQNNEAKFLTK